MLIIYFHSVWLGFELFQSLKLRCIVIRCSFTLVRKEYDNHHCHNKLPDRKWDWSVNDDMPGRDGPENLRILKKRRLRLDRWGIEFCLLLLRHLVKFCRSLPIEILTTTRYTVRWGGVSIIRIVSLSSCRHRPKPEIYEPFVPETTDSACFRICIIITDITKLYNNSALTSSTTPVQSGLGGNGNEVVLHIP